MIPTKQRNRHDPDNGVYGDCHRAALASILELPIDDVPHFMDGLGPYEGEEFARRETEFLASRGLNRIIVAVGPDVDLQSCLDHIGTWNPGIYYLLGGESKSGCGHTVVCLNTRIVHDPSPKETGIVGPMQPDGCYWVTFIGAAIAVAR